MKILAIVALFAFSSQTVTPQTDCDCARQFSFLRSYMERNYPGFNDKVNGKTVKKYRELSDSLQRLAGVEKREIFCAGILKSWTKFFRDGHIQIGFNSLNISESDTAAIDSINNATEHFNISDSRLKELSRQTDPTSRVEGVYVYKDSTYKVVVLGKFRPGSDYAGVILESRTKFWEPGEVKFELSVKSGTKDTFSGLFYYRDHHAEVTDFVFQKGTFNDGEWVKEGVVQARKSKDAETAAISELPFSARKIDDSTLYIRIAWFDGQFARLVDSVVTASDSLLRRLPNLVLDLRGNGGGSDWSYHSLLPLIYTGQFMTSGVEVLSTEDNRRAWESLLADNTMPEDVKNEVRQKIDSMKIHPDQFTTIVPDFPTRFDSVLPFPKRIAVLMNKGCGSTTEQFLLAAKESRKVTLMGENSAGVLDYSNQRGMKFPCGHFMLYYPTTRSRRLPNNPIDNIGIEPDITLPAGGDWVMLATKHLEGK